MSEPFLLTLSEPGVTRDALLHQIGTAFPEADLLFLFDGDGFLLDASLAARGFLGSFPSEGPGPHLSSLFVFPKTQESDPRLWAGQADEFYLSLTNPTGDSVPVAAHFSEGTWNDDAIHFAACKVVGPPRRSVEKPPEPVRTARPERPSRSRALDRRKVKIDALISEIYAQLIRLDPPSLAREIPLALESIGRSIHADRAYLIHFFLDQGFARTVYEWCAPGIHSHNVQLNGPPAQAITWWMAALANQEIIHISNLDYLPPEAQAEKDLLRAQGIRSMAAAPLVAQSQAIGFLGLDTVLARRDWSPEDLYLLQRASEIFAKILADI
ncbi:MAG TPA: GAF domain-containing protein [Anaerolineaceae bacterium]|nr:GAF domain-containing protein [Anaerolineaceae bacterium]